MASSRQKHLNQALMRIPRRAENTDRDSLAATYVSAGSFSAMLHSTDHQILYGRRGTGKTHALLHLTDLVRQTGDVAVYVDLRTIGSTGGVYGDPTVNLAQRGTHLLVDTLEALHDELLSTAVEVDGREALLPALDALAEAATSVQVVGQVEHETKVGDGFSQHQGVHLAMRGARISTGRHDMANRESRLRRSGIEQHHVVFGPLNRALRDIVRALGGARLWLLLDEWSSIPLDLQPLLADLVRRGILPVTGATVKIAAIERRCQFRSGPSAGSDYLGIEVGADAAHAASLDDFLLFDHVRGRAQDFFQRLFHNHLSLRLSEMLGEPQSDVLDQIFKRGAFTELVRASEGVPRDAINIAALAAQNARDEPIGVADIRRAARDWFLRDKQTAITSNEPTRQTLRLLVDEVVGRRGSRTFLISHLACPDAIDELYDARLLHVVRRGVADRRHPGHLYDGFAVDFGCYVSLLLDGCVSGQPTDKSGWLTSAKGIPPAGFNFAKEAIDLARLGHPASD
ncbi:hypothetical protein LWC34_27455 [Kibdelosporangium philippinense]|uniref:AAA+ ATPase domain-containing protein n=1 Tax=Kibdelosporangium philippinense TaxID=211113 RepID=A0ABS8ZFD4_9PSEU|nr:hypothetical protein [Kibdelosporangium philippinense]MCE7006539.1 hypothetical protein [Kibdelosporangium philippinense]